MLATIVSYGGWVLVAIGLASLVGLAVVVERCWRLWPLQAGFRRSVDGVFAALRREGAAAAGRLVDNPTNAMDRVLHQGLEMRDGGRELVREAALEAAQREVPTLERGLRIVGTVAQVAPLLGLLGTMIGLIDAFRAAGGSDAVTASALAEGIYLALGTTAAGLTVAIPAWIAYNGLVGLSARLTDQLEHAAGELPLLLERRR